MSTPEPVAVETQPSSDVVLDALKTLRRGVGITPKRVRLEAPALMELRAIDSQLNYAKLNPGDRHVAAFQLVRCTIENKIRTAVHQKVLLVALNYPSLANPADHTDRTSYDDRAWYGAQLLFWADAKTFKRHADEALEDLATSLVQQVATPCSQRGEDIEFDKGWAENNVLRALLSMMTVEARMMLQEQLADYAVAQTPLLQDAWELLDAADDESVRGSLLIQAFLETLERQGVPQDLIVRAGTVTMTIPDLQMILRHPDHFTRLSATKTLYFNYAPHPTQTYRREVLRGGELKLRQALLRAVDLVATAFEEPELIGDPAAWKADAIDYYIKVIRPQLKSVRPPIFGSTGEDAQRRLADGSTAGE